MDGKKIFLHTDFCYASDYKTLRGIHMCITGLQSDFDASDRSTITGLMPYYFWFQFRCYISDFDVPLDKTKNRKFLIFNIQIEPLQLYLSKQQAEIENFLTRITEQLTSRVQQLVCLINNYDLILNVLEVCCLIISFVS